MQDFLCIKKVNIKALNKVLKDTFAEIKKTTTNFNKCFLSLALENYLINLMPITVNAVSQNYLIYTCT